MNHRKYLVTLLTLMILAVSSAAGKGLEDLQPIGIAVHLDTNIGGGTYTIREIAGFLDEQGIDGAVFCDHDNAEITYGLFPFRRFFKRTMSLPSIERYGAGRYIADIEEAIREFPDLVLIPGAEAVPFYYWGGNPLTGDLKLFNWQEHMLVLGLEKPEDYSGLPAIHRDPGGDLKWSWMFALFIPACIMGAGFYIARKRIIRTFKFDRLTYRTVSRWPIVPGAVLILFSILLLAELSPVNRREIDQYHGDRGALPYQKLIDHANAVGALTFWAHPEAVVNTAYDDVQVITEPYHRHLLETDRYTGFAIFWSGDVEIGSPGGIWDQVLLQYLSGEREHPVWAVGELDWEGENGSGLIGETITVCFAAEKNREGVLGAMRNGRMIAMRNSLWSRGSSVTFSVHSRTGEYAIVGGELSVSEPPDIRFSLDLEKKRDLRPEVRLVRNGRVIFSGTLESGEDWVYRETEVPPEGKTWYYRLTVGSGFDVLATNPVFVKRAVSPPDGRMNRITGV